MTDTLTRAANDASEALGLHVEAYEEGRNAYLVHVYAPLDEGEEMPVIQRGGDHRSTLAYLEGLECGARIMRERHARLRRSADDTYLWCCTHAVAFRLTDICQSLKAALANLED